MSLFDFSCLYFFPNCSASSHNWSHRRQHDVCCSGFPSADRPGGQQPPHLPPSGLKLGVAALEPFPGLGCLSDDFQEPGRKLQIQGGRPQPAMRGQALPGRCATRSVSPTLAVSSRRGRAFRPSRLGLFLRRFRSQLPPSHQLPVGRFQPH